MLAYSSGQLIQLALSHGTIRRCFGTRTMSRLAYGDKLQEEESGFGFQKANNFWHLLRPDLWKHETIELDPSSRILWSLL
eukprot:g7103.t1